MPATFKSSRSPMVCWYSEAVEAAQDRMGSRAFEAFAWHRRWIE